MLPNKLSKVLFTTQMTINKFLLVIMRVPQNKIFENARQTIRCKKNIKGYFRTNMNLSLRSNIDNRSNFGSSHTNGPHLPAFQAKNAREQPMMVEQVALQLLNVPKFHPPY